MTLLYAVLYANCIDPADLIVTLCFVKGSTVCWHVYIFGKQQSLDGYSPTISILQRSKLQSLLCGRFRSCALICKMSQQERRVTHYLIVILLEYRLLGWLVYETIARYTLCAKHKTISQIYLFWPYCDFCDLTGLAGGGRGTHTERQNRVTIKPCPIVQCIITDKSAYNSRNGWAMPHFCINKFNVSPRDGLFSILYRKTISFKLYHQQVQCMLTVAMPDPERDMRTETNK